MPTLNGYHVLDARLLTQPINVVVIGAGGSGSHVVADLAVLHQSMLDLGHPDGLSVTVIDDDCVSAANIGRARFYAADVGANKAQTIVHRVNVCYGLDFRAVSGKVTAKSGESPLFDAVDLVIGCVDTRNSRRSIRQALGKSLERRPESRQSIYWLDMGNGEHDGQVILGETSHSDGPWLPCITDLYPDLRDASKDPQDAGPSCSRAEALARQSAFVNKAASLHAIGLLSMLFRHGRIDHCGVFFSLLTGRSSVLPCDPAAWERFGYRAPAAENSPRL